MLYNKFDFGLSCLNTKNMTKKTNKLKIFMYCKDSLKKNIN